LYRGGQFYWWRKPEYTEKMTDLPEVTDLIIRYDLLIGCIFEYEYKIHTRKSYDQKARFDSITISQEIFVTNSPLS